MGLLRNLEIMLGSIITRKVDSALFNWMEAVSLVLDGENPVMAQLNWFIDPVNGNDNNTGLTASTALKTDGERQRRMGPNPVWNGGDFTYTTPVAYHIRYLNDVPATDPVKYFGTRGRNANIFLHGSQVNGQGQSVLFTGTIDALVTLDNTTAGATTSWQITANALPASWTGSGLVNHRIRLTSGANIGARSWVIKDLGAKQARCAEFFSAATYTFPFNGFASTQVPPALNDTFVVERLTSINQFLWNIYDLDDYALNTGFSTGCFESLAIGVDHTGVTTFGDMELNFGSGTLNYDGCQNLSPGLGTGGFIQFTSCGFYHGMFSGQFTTVTVYGGYAAPNACAAMNIGLGAFDSYWILDLNFIFQYAAGGFQGIIQNFCQIGNVGFFDCTKSQLFLIGGGMSNGVQFYGKLWGTGNTGRAFDFFAGVTAGFAAATTAFNFSIATTPEIGFEFDAGTRTAIRAFDDAAGTYTAARNTTFTNLLATVAAGGFGKHMADPVSGCGFYAF